MSEPAGPVTASLGLPRQDGVERRRRPRDRTAVRRLQHGRLQAYILYLVAGLAALGGLVLLGGVS